MVCSVNIQNTARCAPASAAAVGAALRSRGLRAGGAGSASCAQGGRWMLPECCSRVIQVWPVQAVESDDGSVACPLHRAYTSMGKACLLLGLHILRQKS